MPYRVSSKKHFIKLKVHGNLNKFTASTVRNLSVCVIYTFVTWL